jgi:hypothetical protein
VYSDLQNSIYMSANKNMGDSGHMGMDYVGRMAAGATGTISGTAQGVGNTIIGALNYAFSWRGVEYGIAKTLMDMGRDAIEQIFLSAIPGANTRLGMVAVDSFNNALQGGLLVG